MNRLLIILSGFLLFFSNGIVRGQEFYSSLNNYNRLLINPAYAGLNYESNFSTSWALYSKSKDEPFREYSLVYDFYAPKIEGGAAFFMKQGLQGDRNINTLELGFSYSPRLKRFDGNITPSVYIGLQQPVKHWFVYGLDEWRNSFEQYENVPGKAYLRAPVFKLGGGLLFIAGKSKFGFSGNYGFQVQTDQKVASSQKPYKIVAHYEKQTFVKTDGVLSRSKQISRQLLLHFENRLFQAKAEIMASGPKFLYSAFVANNFTDNLQNVGGSAGFENRFYRIILSGSIGSSIKSEHIAIGSSVTFIYKLPTENVKRLMPFKPRNE